MSMLRIYLIKEITAIVDSCVINIIIARAAVRVAVLSV